jgi:RNA polymerase sigma-70 factor (ECF subfamily)
MNGGRPGHAPTGPAWPGRKNPEDLEHLLGRVASGDNQAFAMVYDQLAGPVLGLARAMAGDSAWSQEVAAEALTEVWHAAPRYDPSGASARSWVMRVARQHVASRLRAARTEAGRRDPAGLDGHRTSQPAADTPSVAAPASGAEHQAVLLALYGGLTQDEISDRLGLTAEAVAGLIRDGLVQAAAGEPAS